MLLILVLTFGIFSFFFSILIFSKKNPMGRCHACRPSSLVPMLIAIITPNLSNLRKNHPFIGLPFSHSPYSYWFPQSPRNGTPCPYIHTTFLHTWFTLLQSSNEEKVNKLPRPSCVHRMS